MQKSDCANENCDLLLCFTSKTIVIFLPSQWLVIWLCSVVVTESYWMTHNQILSQIWYQAIKLHFEQWAALSHWSILSPAKRYKKSKVPGKQKGQYFVDAVLNITWTTHCVLNILFDTCHWTWHAPPPHPIVIISFDTCDSLAALRRGWGGEPSRGVRSLSSPILDSEKSTLKICLPSLTLKNQLLRFVSHPWLWKINS